MNLQQFPSGLNIKDDGINNNMLTQQSIPSPPCSIPDQQASNNILYNQQMMIGIPSPNTTHGFNALLIDTVCCFNIKMMIYINFIY